MGILAVFYDGVFHSKNCEFFVTASIRLETESVNSIQFDFNKASECCDTLTQQFKSEIFKTQVCAVCGGPGAVIVHHPFIHQTAESDDHHNGGSVHIRDFPFALCDRADCRVLEVSRRNKLATRK